MSNDATRHEIETTLMQIRAMCSGLIRSGMPEYQLRAELQAMLEAQRIQAQKKQVMREVAK